MQYEMEELVPIVANLARKYTGCASSSITYEKAEQLMETVLYCIREAELSCRHSLVLGEGISAQQAYELGAAYVEKKAREALHLYHEVLAEFCCYENQCLYDTFYALPEFFRRYDSRFAPQHTILTLDYPVLEDLSADAGVDKIYAFIRCIRLEQKFLQGFPENYVVHLLSKYSGQYKEMIENLCEIVLAFVVEHILVGKPLSEPDLQSADKFRIREIFVQNDLTDICLWATKAVKTWMQKYYGGCGELSEYLLGSVDGILMRLKCTAE